jgi:hypothetical protein
MRCCPADMWRRPYEMPRTILVTGGAGFIGSHICKALAQSGFKPIAYDNLSTGHADSVRWGPFIEGDILDRGLLKATLKEFRAILRHSLRRQCLCRRIRRRSAQILSQQCRRQPGASGCLPRAEYWRAGIFLQLRHLWRAAAIADPRRNSAGARQSLRTHEADFRNGA